MYKSTSIKNFRHFLVVRPDGSIDASQIHSKECYHSWLEARQYPESDENAKKFYRALSNHISGVDGRSPFSPEEETAILKVFRLKQRWPCFPHLSIGLLGYRSKGFHEKGFLASQGNKKLKLSPAEEEEEEEVEGMGGGGKDDFNVTREEENINCMTNQVASYMESFPMFQMELWKGVVRIYRMAMLSRPPPVKKWETATKDYVQELMLKAEREKGPHYFVLIYDGVAQELDQRIVAQNALAVSYFGELPGKLSRRMNLIDVTEVIRIIFAFLYIVHRPGHEYTVSKLKVRHSVTGEIRYLDTTFCCDPNTYFLVSIFGRISDL